MVNLHTVKSTESMEQQTKEIQEILKIANVGDKIVFYGTKNELSFYYTVISKKGVKSLQRMISSRDDVRFY
jgi:uncharacterized protein YfkK (UPF0435 family)